ncbi:hypothetical protein [Nocardia sp. NPDC057668]|uniref:hypothetical protein n=1 Tax=Nocardia sp. NPDC057668 TaxID=3346202 RepID=UPI00366D4F4B
MDTFKVEFEATQLADDANHEMVVTVDPNVPSRYQSVTFDGLGSGPSLTLLMLAGNDRIQDLMMCLSRGNYAAENLWPQARRLYEYYLEGDWVRFNKIAEEFFGDEWTRGETTHERASVAHHAVGTALANMIDDHHEASSIFMRRFLRKHMAAIQNDRYRAFAVAESESGRISALQRSLLDVTDHFVQRFECWTMGVLGRVIPDGNREALADLRLFRDEFDILRDLYQQGFEIACKFLRYLVAVQNVIKRGDPELFGIDVPAGLSRKNNPTGIDSFEKMANADKLHYISAVPGWEGWASLLSNKTRNDIGHATARHDLRRGLIVSSENPAGIPYIDMVAKVYGVFDVLATCFQIVRQIRVVSSPDFID